MNNMQPHILFSVNAVFTLILIVGLAVLTLSSPETALSSLIEGSASGVTFAVKLFSVYAVWLSVLNLWQKSGFDKFLADKIRPLLKKIFPKENESCYTHLAVNLSANLIGMGSAGTPAGMLAVEEMREKKNRAMLIVINSTSIQLIPTTIVALRSSYGATTDIILPTLLSTVFTTACGVLLVKAFVK